MLAGIAQSVERNLAKVSVARSSRVTRFYASVESVSITLFELAVLTDSVLLVLDAE